MLINNAMMEDKGKGRVHKTDDKDLLALVNANTFPVVFMSRFLGPEMKARKKKSAIINVVGYKSERPSQTEPVMSAGAGFSGVFSEVLGYEN